MQGLLPLGSILKMKVSEAVLMIVGYYPINREKKHVYKYMAVAFPYGVTDTGNVMFLDESDIEKVIRRGYENTESTEFLNRLSRIMDREQSLEEFIR